jgi:hypothetical protein
LEEGYKMKDMNVSELVRRYNRLKDKAIDRDNKMSQIKAIREGKMSSIAPDVFPEIGWQQEPIVANMIDIAARDMAELLAPLPMFTAINANMTSERQRENATMKTKIAQAYVYNSDLATQMQTGADWYVSYGFLPLKVELDYETFMPIIRAINPMGTYYECDRFGNVVSFFQKLLIDKDDLINQYPEMADTIRNIKPYSYHSLGGSNELEIVLYHDKDYDIAFINDGANNLVLDKSKNPIGRVMVKIAQRPGLAGVRGQFDDVIYLQIARAYFGILQMRAADEAVKAPLAAPLDLQDMPYGDGAILKSSEPQNIRRIPLEIPQSVMLQGQTMEKEFMDGSRFPKIRTGNLNASIITGRGVEALADISESQLSAHRTILVRIYQELIGLCYEADVKVFGDIQKSITSVSSGVPYEVRYVPSKVIKEDYTITAKYGLMAGLDPNRWLVFGLQARADKIFSRDYMRREFPADIDVEDEAIKVDIENMEEALMQSLMGWAQSIPVLAGQGQDPSKPVLAIVNAIDARRKGKSVTEAISNVFLAEKEEQDRLAAEQQAMMAEQMAGAGTEGLPTGGEEMIGPDGLPLPAGASEGVPEGLSATGLIRGVAPGQQGMMPGGRPDLATLLAGLTSRGEPNLQANITRNVAI